MITVPRTRKGKRINLAAFAAKCIADNVGPRGSRPWIEKRNEVRALQKAGNVTSKDFEGMSLSEIRRGARIED